MKSNFCIYVIEEELHFHERRTILVKVQTENVFNDFDTYNDAEKWIKEIGERQFNYTILPTYRHL